MKEDAKRKALTAPKHLAVLAVQLIEMIELIKMIDC